ncbi:Tim44-like domain protein [Pseudovibrio axinellae]|uniref:Tim44-like domain protein n=1 Tax=Pseudovibrio axinellae TaxID=989403 RepID=A0A165XTS8_9HYPH|nr:Tim44 domain-containing protein [Pseudovibrio axinellae]KZL18030.1 Tim44-like domain protein [Pseudovibrio axinellae]SER12917.1 Predicted lipid-binding transport protein, Tim44 family [Pseudovibrio axinellae]
MLALKKFPKFLTALVFAVGLMFVTTDFAEAKRGFSFGSRGSRSWSAPKSTNTAPKTAPVQRSMTPDNGPKTGAQQSSAAAASKAATGQKRGFFGGGMIGSMLGGLALGGLIGMLFGGGFGGAAGMFGLIIQMLLIGGGIMLLMRFLRGRQQPQPAGANGYQPAPEENQSFSFNDAGAQDAPRRSGSSGIPNTGFGGTQAAQPDETPVFSSKGDDELGVTAEDFDAFEALLTTVWTAYGSENYGKIREVATPEIMGYFAEELGKAASKGLINEVHSIKLLQGDLSESWNEDGKDYASVAMRYEAIDVMRERSSNKVVEGNADVPEERREIWTFIREAGEAWKLSAIQQAD